MRGDFGEAIGNDSDTSVTPLLVSRARKNKVTTADLHDDDPVKNVRCH